jgi:hypothetical protein
MCFGNKMLQAQISHKSEEISRLWDSSETFTLRARLNGM